MSDHHMKPQLVEKSCSIIMNTVKAIPLNYNITETPYSIYLILRKSLVMSTEGFEGLQIVNQDLRIRRLEEANSNLSADLKKCHSAGGRGVPNCCC